MAALKENLAVYCYPKASPEDKDNLKMEVAPAPVCGALNLFYSNAELTVVQGTTMPSLTSFPWASAVLTWSSAWREGEGAVRWLALGALSG